MPHSDSVPGAGCCFAAAVITMPGLIFVITDNLGPGGLFWCFIVLGIIGSAWRKAMANCDNPWVRDLPLAVAGGCLVDAVLIGLAPAETWFVLCLVTVAASVVIAARSPR
jgi:hypothetical protein